jgi:eukaryotic translation initiation factor 2C
LLILFPDYNFTIKDPNLHVVNVGPRDKPSYLPADVCRVVPGQPSSAKLTASQTSRMIDFAVRMPAQNAQSVVTNGARMLALGSPTNTTLVSKSNRRKLI